MTEPASHRIPRLLAALLALLLASTAAAQELFVDAIDVEVVNVEVVVTDKDGNPVTDLGPGDFTVYEDGEPVELVNFYAVDRRTTGEAEGERPEAPATLLPADVTRQLHLVVLVDQDGLLPQTRAALFHGLRQDVERAFAAGGKVMVAAQHDGIDIVVPFTEDRERVLTSLDELAEVAAVDAIDPRLRSLVSRIDRAATPGATLQLSPGAAASQEADIAIDNAMALASEIRVYAEHQMRVVRRRTEQTSALIDTLSGLPGRKAVLFLTDGISRRPADFLVEVWREKFESWMDSTTSQFSSMALMDKERFVQLSASSEFDASDDISRMVRHAAARKVAFYPIAPPGRSSLTGTQSLSPNRGAGQLESFHKQEALLELAEDTGGAAYTDSANVGGLLDRLAQDFEHFYSLGYTPPNLDDAYHKIRVEVARPGVEVRYGRGYRNQDPGERLRALTLAALHYGAGDNPLAVGLETTAREPAGKDRALLTLEVRIPYDRLLLLPADDTHEARLKMVIIVRDVTTGGTSEPHVVDLPMSIPNHELLQALAASAVYPMQLQIEAGEKQIAVGLRDELSGIDSTMRIEVVVPESG